ncbi:hypothetical protein [Mesorhizobium sp. M0488]|uniref:hypothetical protein n=1 Tax=unclassified Mesorhizobium TaxID=325217 RepID=UPI00333818B7
MPEEMLLERGIVISYETIRRRRLTPIRIRKSKYLNNRIGTGSSPHPADARLQITSIRRKHPKRVSKWFT